jgi:hypothetical protein
MIARRPYIDKAGIRAPQLRFVWDEWNVKSTYQPARSEEVARLQTLSKRANCALTIAVGEWILARFEGMDAAPDPAMFLEATWAANVDTRYAHQIEIVDNEWRGPVRGPISMALTFVIDALFAEEAGPNSSMNPAWAACFARHVLPRSDAFDPWLAVCLERLEAFYPAPAEDDADWFEPELSHGLPPPIELFDPDWPFDPRQADELIDRFLRGLNPEANEFLATRAELTDLRFDGVTYRYPP